MNTSYYLNEVTSSFVYTIHTHTHIHLILSSEEHTQFSRYP